MPESFDPSKYSAPKTTEPTKSFDPTKFTSPKGIPLSGDRTLAGYNFNINVDRYKRFISTIYPEALEREAAYSQSGWSKTGNMFMQGVLGEILAQGTVGGLGSIVELPKAIWDETHQRDADFSNFMTRFADNISNEVKDKFPIFRYNPGKSFDWKDWGWWTENGVSIFSTLGLLIPAMGEVKAASWISKGLKEISTLSKINKANAAVKGLSKVGMATSDIFNTEKYWQQLTHSAIAMRNAENMREASQSFLTNRDETLKLFQNEEEYQKVLNSEVGQEFLKEGRPADKVELANFIASKSAWKNYSTNAINIVFDAMQLAPIFKGFKIETRSLGLTTSKAVKTAQRNAINIGKEISEAATKPHFNASSFLLGTSVLLGEQVSEGVEEFVNAVSQSDSNWYGKHLLGKEKDKSFTDRMDEYMEDPSTWEQAFWGFAGGVAFSGLSRTVGDIKNKINGINDPHSDTARIEEIKNRSIKIAGRADRIKRILSGININTNLPFVGDENTRKQSQADMIQREKTALGYDLGFNASRTGNVELLLDMISHPNFKEEMIKLGLTDEVNFTKELESLRKNILDAERTYKVTYDKIFTATNRKPYLRELIINQAVNKKVEIENSTRLRDAARTKLTGLKTNNPAYEALKEQNKDKDFDGTLENMVNAQVISYLEQEVKNWNDESARRVATERLNQIKEEFKLSTKDLKDKEASGDFNSISDIIKASAEAKVYDLFVHVDNSLYEEVLDTNKSITKTETILKNELNSEYDKQLETFRSKVAEAGKIDIKVDNSTTIDSKIATINSMIEELDKNKVDPYTDENSPTKKLNEERYKVYKEILEQKKQVLENQKVRFIADEQSGITKEAKNTELINKFNEIFKKIGIVGVDVKYTGKTLKDAITLVSQDVVNLAVNPNSPSPYGRLIKLISEGIEIYSKEEIEKLVKFLNNDFEALTKGKIIEEIVNAILVNAGYIVLETSNPVVDARVEKHIQNAEAFKAGAIEENIKPITDFTSQNPIIGSLVDRANRWITDIINDGDKPLFEEHPKHGTLLSFEKIAARYAEIVGSDRFINDYDALVQAYQLVRTSKINPETGQKRLYTTDRTLKTLSAEKILFAYGIKDEHREEFFRNIHNLDTTGGEDALNVYIPAVKTELDPKTGDQIASNKDLDKITTLLNSLGEDSRIIVHIDSKYEGREGFSQNKNNSDLIPIVVEAIDGDKRIPIAYINTMKGIHDGVKYNFNGKDWTDVIINDSKTSNNKLELLNNLMPLIQAFFNAQKMGENKSVVSKAFTDLLDADIHDVLYDLVGRDINIRSETGMKAFTHIARTMFFGQNTSGATPIKFDRNDVVANVIRWKDKLTRDHINAKIVRNTLGIDIDNIIESKVTYITSGTLVTSKNEDGTIKYRNLSVIDSPDKIQLYRIKKDTNSTQVENTRDNSMLPKKTGIGVFSHDLFVGIQNRSGIIPVPVRNNTLGGNLLDNEYSNKIYNKIINLLSNLGDLKRRAGEATKTKNLVEAEQLHIQINQLVDTLRDVINIDYSDQNHLNALIIDRDIRFKLNGVYYVYDFFKGESFRTERIIDEKTKAEKNIDKAEFFVQLGNLAFNVNYKKLGGKPYTDLLGNKHNSYEEYLINTNTIVTHVGQLVDSKGNKISNFTISEYSGTGGTPISLNIDTSHLKTKAPNTDFTKFANQFKLDSRYNFVFQILDNLIKFGDVKFNGALEISKIDKASGKPMLVFYNPSKKSLTVTKDWVELYKKNPVDATLALVHDTLHSLIGSKSKEEQEKLMTSLTNFRNDLLATPEYKILLEKADKTEEENKILAILKMKDVEELLTYGLTDSDLARFLDSIKTEVDSKTVTFWSRLKEIIKELANLFGIGTKLDELSSIFDQFMTGQEIKKEERKEGTSKFDNWIDEDEEFEKPVLSFDKNSPNINLDQVKYVFRATEILQSEKAKQIFEKGNKNNWDLNKILSELQVPKDQKELLLSLNIKNREDLIIELNSRYGFVVESKISKQDYSWNSTDPVLDRNNNIIKKGEPTQYYSNLTVPGGTNYTENEISTPAIVPSIKGHAQFATENGIGWFRSDEQQSKEYKSNNELDQVFDKDRFKGSTTRRILEIQSDLFQKGRSREDLTNATEYKKLQEQLKGLPKFEYKGDRYEYDSSEEWYGKNGSEISEDEYFKAKFAKEKEPLIASNNQFLQLLNKDNNWVTFFVKTILQDSAKKGYEKVLFPTGDTSAKVEGHETLKEFKKAKEEKINILEESKKKLTINYKHEVTLYGVTVTKVNKNDLFKEGYVIASINEYNIEKPNLLTGEKVKSKSGYQYSYINLSKDDEKQFELSIESQRNTIDREIAQYKSEIERVEKEGFAALKPIYHFYEEVVTNILKKIGKFETITDEYDNTWNEVNLKDIKDQVEVIKASVYSSNINKQMTGSPFELDEEENILNVLSNIFIRDIASKYTNTRGKDVSRNEIRYTLVREFAKQGKARDIDGTLNNDQKKLIFKTLEVLHDDDKFWKLFKIHLSNEFGYEINEQDDYEEDIDLLEKSWDNSDVLTKNPLLTINDQIKNLVDTTYEVDPNSVQLIDGKPVYRTNTNTPTGFANTITFARYGNKLIDLMKGSQNKEEMLDAILKYAINKNSVFGKSMYSIHKRLKEDENLLNAWFTSFDRAIIDSYKDLNRTVYTEEGTYSEITLTTNKNTVEYNIANEWTNKIVSRGENKFYDQDWIDNYDKLYKETATLSSNFTKVNPEVAANIVQLYNQVGIDISIEDIQYQFRENQNDFVSNIIAPLRNIKGIPGVKYNTDDRIPYIDRLQKFPNTAFNEFGNLLRLASKIKYLREDHFSYSSINISGNMIFNANKPSFISNLFKQLEGTPETITSAFKKYTNVLSNQHSLLLWGDQYLNGELVREGRGIFDYEIQNNQRIPIKANMQNVENIKVFGYEGTKSLNENFAIEYNNLSKYDWSLRNLIYYFGGGKSITKDQITEKVSAIFPMLNPSDRKQTKLFEAPVINLSTADYIYLVKATLASDNIQEALKLVRNIPIFKAIYQNAIDEIIAMNTAKETLFELVDGKAVEDGKGGYKLKKEFEDDTNSAQVFYHYKLKNGEKKYITFYRDGDVYRLDQSASGNIFDINSMFLTQGNKQITFVNNIFINNINFLQHLMVSSSLRDALYTPLRKGDENSTFANQLEQFTLRFIGDQITNAINKLGVYRNIIESSYIKRENVGKESKTFILKGKDFEHSLVEYALNTYLFNIEQVRLFHGSLADYKSNIDFNKRGGQIVANGIPSVHRGFYNGATISDVKIKSKVYNEMINTFLFQLESELPEESSKIKVRKNRLQKLYTDKELLTNTIEVDGKEEQLFHYDKDGRSVEREVYDLMSPYLSNDSANAVSLITFEEFEKRIAGFGLTTQYSAIINKIKNGGQLNREETARFASMQKNFYYSLDYNEKLQKLVPTQVKNAEVVLTPAMIKNLQLERLEKKMKELRLVQVNLESAEKVGSLHIANIADEEGNLLDDAVLDSELKKAIHTYNYEGLRMQLEVPDAIFEENITMSRQFAKKLIENIPDEGVDYTIGGKTYIGSQLKSMYFKLLNSNIFQDAHKVMTEFDVRVDKDGNIIGDIDYNKIVEILEKEGIDRHLSKNILYSLQIGENDSVAGKSRIPFFFNTNSVKWENILTSIFTNNVTNQKFPGLHAAQMSSLFMNKRDNAVKLQDLTSLDGINWHSSVGVKTDTNGKVTNRKDIKLRSTLYNMKEGIIQEAEVLLPRWAKEFYQDGEYIDINSLSDEVRTMIGYRIPMEAKYSAYVFKVVGFLPDDNGPSIVLPDNFVTQTGSDFDMDTVFAFLYNLHTRYEKTINEEGKPTTKKIVERISYTDGNTKADLKARVDAIMSDQSQLIHILSLKLDNEELIKTIEKLNKIKSEYFATFDKTSPIYEKYAEQFKRINSLNKRIAKSKYKERRILEREVFEIQSGIYIDEEFIYFKERDEYKDIEQQVSDIIKDLPIDEQNTRKARENQILDIYYSILTNLYHYSETIATSNFRGITRVKEKIDKALGNSNFRVNNLTFDGQLQYREKSQQGRDLKGISIAADRFNSIAQVAHINLTEKLRNDKGKISNIITLPVCKYEVTPIQKKELIKNYGDDVKFEKENGKEYAIVTHRYIGNNPSNTFKNVLGQFINQYSAQSTANILDHVAFPLPNNVNKYTINIWKLLPSLGSTFDISTALINQPIIRDLTNTFYNNLNNVKRGSEIEITKRKFQTLLYQVMVANGKETRKNWESNIANGKSIWVSSGKFENEQYKYLGYRNRHGITLNDQELIDNINVITLNDKGEFEEITRLLKSEEKDKMRLTQIENHLRYQLQILETFIHLKSYSDGVTDGTNTLNTDKIGAGPTFDTTHKLIYEIERIEKQGILEINKASAMTQLFPRLFGSTKESVYPSLEQFFIFSNLLSLKAFGQYFIGQSELYRNIKSKINKLITDKKYDVKLAQKVTNYFNNALLNDLPWLNDMSIEEQRQLLGINTELNLDIDVTDEVYIAEFQELSLANQIMLLQDLMIYNEEGNIVPKYGYDHILRSLKIATQEGELKKNKHYKVTFINNDRHDEMSQSLNDMWYSDNVYERIVARNLIRYEYLTNGFGFGYSSFSKVIPNTILYYETEPFMEGTHNEKGIGLSSHLYSKLKKVNSLVFSGEEDDLDMELNLASDIIFHFDYLDRFIKANWKDDTLVPDASGLKYKDDSIMNEDGLQGGEVRYFQVREHGIITIPAKTMDNIPTSRVSNNVRDKVVIKLNKTNKQTGEIQYQLFKRDDRFVTTDENGNRIGNFYYYPINKLEFTENGDQSIFEENNVFFDGSEIQSEDDYKGIIQSLSKKSTAESLIYPHELAMTMTNKDGEFRPELREYTTTLDLVRAGLRTATTRSSLTSEAGKWENLKVGQYVKLKGTNEYVRATVPLHHIDLSSTRAAREEWSKKEGWDRSYLNKIEDGKPFSERTDLYQFEYEYIGTLDKVIADNNIGLGEEGEVFEDEKPSVYTSSSNENNQITKLRQEISNLKNEINSLSYDIELDEENLIKYERTIEEARRTNQVVDVKSFIQYSDALALNKKKLNNLEAELEGKNDELTDLLLNEVKPSVYTSSTNKAVNKAITSATEFIEKTTISYVNRVKILKNVGTLQDSVEALTDADFRKLLDDNNLAAIAKGLATILKQYEFDLNRPKTETSKGGIIERIKDFENLNMNDIVNDVVLRKEFTGFMSRAISFLKGVTVFEGLSSTQGNDLTEGEKVINELITQLQAFAPSIQNVKSKVDNLWQEYNESYLSQFTTNPEIIAGTRRIFDVGEDENYFQLKLDSMADTNNTYVATMVKRYMVEMINAKDSAAGKIGELEAILRKMFGNITGLTEANFEKYLEHKNGRRTGKLVQKYDWDRFYADKRAYFDEAVKKWGRKSENYARKASAWFRNNQVNTVSFEEFEKIKRKKQEELGNTAFTEWEKRNYREVDGEVQFKIGDSMLSVPSDNYLNPEWVALKDDPLYQKFIEIINEYTDAFGRTTILNEGFIPTLSAKDKEEIGVLDKVKAWYNKHKAKQQSEAFVGENNEMVYILGVPMIEYFTQEKEIKISNKKKDELDADYERRIIQEVRVAGRGTFKTIGEIRAENRRIKKANDDFHAGKINYNLYEVFTNFIQEASIYKAKAGMKHDYDLGLYQLRNMQFMKKDSRNKAMKNKAASKSLDKTITSEIPGQGSNLEKHFAEWLEAIFYGNFDIDEGDWTAIGNILLKFTSAKTMWFNMTAGIDNVLIGKIQTKLESIAGWYFTNENLRKADAMYMGGIPDMIMNLGSTKANSLVNGIIKRMDITQNTNERDFTTGMLKAQLLNINSAYFINDIGEHYLQNVSALAMLDHHRIIDGKIVSLAEYKTNVYREALNSILDESEKKRLDSYLEARYKAEDFKEAKKDYLRDFILNLPIKKQYEFVEAKKKLDEVVTKDFEKNVKFIDVFKLNDDGYTELAEEVEIDGKKFNTKLNENEFAKFRAKAMHVVQKQQGIYNKEDAMTISRTILGKMGIQYKKHIRPGWNKRFGTKFWKSYWAESRDEWNKGAYTSLTNFLLSPFTRHRYIDSDEAKEFRGMMGRILNDFHHFITNIGIYWNTLDDFEKANVKRAITDHIYLATIFTVALLLKKLKPEDDDDENFAYDLTVYEIDRLLSEVGTFTPIGLMNESKKFMKSPAAVQGTAADTYRLLASLVGYPFQDEKERIYRTGVYAGMSKIQVNAIKLVPIMNKIQQLKRIDKFNKYYILFRG